MICIIHICAVVCIMRMLGIKLQDRIRNEIISGKTKFMDIIKHIMKQNGNGQVTWPIGGTVSGQRDERNGNHVWEKDRKVDQEGDGETT